MAASSAADIPESKSYYCPCNRCTVARKQGRQEVSEKVRKLAEKFEQEPYNEMVSYHLAARRILTELNGDQ